MRCLSMLLVLGVLCGLGAVARAVPVALNDVPRVGGDQSWFASNQHVVIAGRVYEGYGFVGDAEGKRRTGSVVFDVTGKTRFTAFAGLSDEWKNDSGALAIEVDGKPVLHIERKSGDRAVIVTIPLQKARTLTIRMTVSILLATPVLADPSTQLVITTTPPGATIFVDGTPAGLSPVTLPQSNVPSWGKRLKIEAQLESFETAASVVTVWSGELNTTHYALHALAAILRVTALPAGGRVFVDGKDSKKTTPCTMLVDMGVDTTKTVMLAIDWPEKPRVEQPATLAAGTECVETFTPRLPPAIVHVTSTPDGAKVLLNGVDTTQVTPCDLTVTSETGATQVVTVAAELPEYQRAEREVTATCGTTVALPLTLEKRAAPITPGARAGEERLNPKDGAVMVWVPAGDFVMGTSEQVRAAWINAHPETGANWFNNEKPQHTVYLDGYWIYKTEVTVAQYRAYCQATGRQARLPNWKGYDATHPLVNVSWDEAQAYAAWAGVQLPTEAEWEKAARGADGRTFPWGNDWDVDKCNNADTQNQAAAIGGMFRHATMPVGSYPTGASPYGCLDMAGNVWEWCADWFDSYGSAPARNPLGPAIGKSHVQRGGSWDNRGPSDFRASRRTSRVQPEGNGDTGFRCARRTLAPTAGHPPATTSVQVTSTPTGARVLLGGIDMARVTPCTIALTLAEHETKGVTVAAVMPGYQRAARQVTVEGGTTISVALTLAKLAVTLPLGPHAGEERTNPQDGAVMVWVPAGNFLMGSLEDDANPQRTVYLDGYWIYKTEVTVARYRAFCQATGRPMASLPNWNGYGDTCPVVNVTWDDAQAYARWAGGQLPTLAQWQKAARGTDGRLFPWGNTWDVDKCNAGTTIRKGNQSPAMPGGSYPADTSPYDCLDMAGNVREWCADWMWWHYNAPARNPTGPPTGTKHVACGGDYRSGNPDDCRTTVQWSPGNPAAMGHNVGFRCTLVLPGP